MAEATETKDKAAPASSAGAATPPPLVRSPLRGEVNRRGVLLAAWATTSLAAWQGGEILADHIGAGGQAGAWLRGRVRRAAFSQVVGHALVYLIIPEIDPRIALIRRSAIFHRNHSPFYPRFLWITLLIDWRFGPPSPDSLDVVLFAQKIGIKINHLKTNDFYSVKL